MEKEDGHAIDENDYCIAEVFEYDANVVASLNDWSFCKNSFYCASCESCVRCSNCADHWFSEYAF